MDTIDESQPRTAMDAIDESQLRTVTHNIQTGLYKLRLLDTTLQTVFHHFNCIVDENNKIINGLVSCRQCCKLVQFQGSNYKQRLTLHMIVCVPESVRNDIETKLSSGVYNIHYEVKRGSQFRYTLLARIFARIFTDSSKTIDGYVWCIKCWKLLKEVYLRAHPCYDPKALLAIAKRESALRKSIYIGYYKLSQVSDSLQKSIWKNFAYITLKRRQSVFEIEYGINIECDYIYCRHCQRVLHYPEEDDEELHLYLHNCGVEKDKLFRRNLQSSSKYVVYKKSIEDRIRLFRYALKPIKSQRLFINERFAHIIQEDNTQLKDMVCCYKCLKVKKYVEPLDIFYLFQHSCCCVQNLDTTGDKLIIRAKMEANIRENLKKGSYRTEQLTNQRNAMWKVFAIIKTEDDKTLDDFVYCLKCRELCEFKNNNTCPAHKCLEKYKAKQMARRIAINLKCGKYKLKFVENRKSRMWKVFAVICDEEQKPIKNFLYCRQCQQALEVSTGSEKESIAQHECLVNYEVVGNESKLQKNECDNGEELKGKGSKRLYENDQESIRNYKNKRLKVKEKSVQLETNNEIEPGDGEKGTSKENQEDKITSPRCYGQRENMKSKNTIGYDAESVTSKNIESPHRREDNEVVFEKIPGTREDSSYTYKLWYERKASNKSDDDKSQEENVEKIEIQLEPIENEEVTSAGISKGVKEIENANTNDDDNRFNIGEQIPDTLCNSPIIQLERVSENNEHLESVVNANNNESHNVNKIIHIKDEPIHLDSNFEFIGRNEEFSVVCCRHCQTLLTYNEANLGYHQCVEAGNAKNSISNTNPERPKCSSANDTPTITSQGNSEEYFVIQELEDAAKVRIKEEIEKVTDNEIVDSLEMNSNYEKIGYKENNQGILQTPKRISNIVDKKLNSNSDITISSEEISSGDEESCESIGDLQTDPDFEMDVGEISDSEEDTISESDIDLQNDSNFPRGNNDEIKNNEENCNDYMDLETNNDEENEEKPTDGAEENCRQDENVLRLSDGNSCHNVDENSDDCIEVDIKLEKSDDFIEIYNSEDGDNADKEKRVDKNSKEKCNSKTKHSAKLSATKSTPQYQLFANDFENIYHGNYAETEDEIYIEIESD